jgi:mannosyltransferase OCH1-like enzyme
LAASGARRITSPPSAPSLPRLIHRVWIGGPEPDWTRPFAETWLQPGWELRQWTDANVPELFPLVNQRIYDEAPSLAPNHVGQLRSDVLRYELLARHGGVYVDHDFQALRPIDPLLEGVDCFAVWEVEGRWIANGLMGAVAGHPFLDRLIGGLPASVKAHRGRRPNRMTGPHFLTRSHHVANRPLKVLPEALFFPFGWREAGTYLPGEFDPAERWPEAYGCHWWANQIRERGIAVG